MINQWHFGIFVYDQLDQGFDAQNAIPQYCLYDKLVVKEVTIVLVNYYKINHSAKKPRIPQDISGFPHKPQFVENVTKRKLFISALNVFTGFVMQSNFFYHPNFHLFNIHIFVFKKIPQICTDQNCERYLDNDLWMISLSTSILHLRQFIEGYCWIYGPSGSKKRESGDQLGLHGNLQIY